MEKTKDSIKTMLKEQWKQACNGYLVELLRMWELDAHYGYWVGNEHGTRYCYGETHNLTMEDIMYIVDCDIEEDEVLAWEDYCLDAYEVLRLKQISGLASLFKDKDFSKATEL